MAVQLQKPSHQIPDKPLHRLQLYLTEAKTCIILLRELLVEVKELIFVVGLLILMLWSIWSYFGNLSH